MTKKNMQVWALTGAIAAGKSLASKILIAHGAAVVAGDTLGHQLLARPAIQAAIKETLGPQFVRDGVVDRRRLGETVFADSGALNALNGVMHGPLGVLASQELTALAAAGDHELAVFEAAVYFVLPTPPPVDLVLVIAAEDELRCERLIQRGFSSAEARNRMASQGELQAAWDSAPHVLENNGSRAELEKQILSLLAQHELGESRK